MKQVGLVLLTLVVVIGCKKPKDKTIDFGYNYLPLSVGAEHVYKVDSTVFNDFTGSDSTYTYRQREVIRETYTDAEGRTNYRVEVAKQIGDTGDWNIVRSYAWWKGPEAAQRLDNNVRVVPLVFPVSKANIWDGNAFNKWPEADYRYDYVDRSETINGIVFDSVARVIQVVDTNNLVVKQYKEERYARNLGMVYQEFLHTVRKTGGDSGLHMVIQLEE